MVVTVIMGCPGSSVGKEPACSAGDPGLIPGLGRSTGDGIGYPLQYSGLENSVDCIVHGVAKRRTRLSDFHSLSVTQPLLTDSATELVERGKNPVSTITLSLMSLPSITISALTYSLHSCDLWRVSTLLPYFSTKYFLPTCIHQWEFSLATNNRKRKLRMT